MALIAGSIGLAAPAQAADDTARFYGKWKTTLDYNGQGVPFVSVHDASGYKNYVLIPQGSADVGDGNFSAVDGKWTASAAAPNDSGTYKFMDANTVYCTNATGQGVLWQRDNTPLPPILNGGPVAAPNMLPAGTNLAAVKVSQVIETARIMARMWHPDAFLISAGVFHPSPDGTVNLLANPSAFSLQFYSPSTAQRAIISSNAPAGSLYGGPPTTTAAPPPLVPIPPQAIDLTVAFKNLQLFGFTGGVDQAYMNFSQRDGKPLRLVWVLETGEAYPRVVSAASGALLNPFIVFDDKVADYNQLVAEHQAALARMRGPRRRGSQNELSSAGFNLWEGTSSESGGGSNQQGGPNSSDEQNEDDEYNKSVGEQNAFDQGDMGAVDRIEAGVPTEVDTESYGGGTGE